jgi:hypothetical protein
MRSKRSVYWFPAKKYGWGWGLPDVWQGRAVLVGWVAMVFAGAFILAEHHKDLYFVFLAVMVGALFAVCLEPPRWRWGNK